jgi:uncharacterized protein
MTVGFLRAVLSLSQDAQRVLYRPCANWLLRHDPDRNRDLVAYTMTSSLSHYRWSIALLLTVATTAAGAQQDHRADSAHPLRVFRDARGIVTVQQFDVGRLALDFATGRMGALIPERGDTTRLFSIEGGAREPSAERVLLTEQRGSRLHVFEAGQPTRVGDELSVQTHDVAFQNGAVTLAGLLVLPPGPGPHPVVVTLHGSGAATRNAFVSWAGLFASQGIGTLAYDKRGTGKSTGNWQLSTLVDLADDARAGIAMLRARKDIDPTRVGLLGTSQGPWLATIIAAADPTIAFLLFSSGGGVGGGEQEIFRRGIIVRDSGYSPAQVDTARNVVRRYFAYLASGGADSVGVSLLWRRHASAPWFRLINLPERDPTTADWPPARRVFASDLALGDTLARLNARIKQPIFAIFAGGDRLVPWEIAERHLEDELPRGKAGQLTVVTLPDADHQFRQPAAAGDITRIHPEYFTRMTAWMRERFALNRTR